jgi:hypothetical protein
VGTDFLDVLAPVMPGVLDAADAALRGVVL